MAPLDGLGASRPTQATPLITQAASRPAQAIPRLTRAAPRADQGSPRIALVGATGAVGTAVLDLIADHALPHRGLRLLASARSAGRPVTVRGEDQLLLDTAEFDFTTVDLALFCTPESVSARWVPTARAAGVRAVDASAAYRLDPSTPLLGSGSPSTGPTPVGLAATPGGLTALLAPVLGPVARRWGLRRAVVSGYQSASALGLAAPAELQESTRAALGDPEAGSPGAEHPGIRPFALLPEEDADGQPGQQEAALAAECRRLLGLPALDLVADCIRVPVLHGQAAALWLDCAEPVDRAELLALLGELPGAAVHHGTAPDPTADAPHDLVQVSRVRAPGDGTALLWLTGDQLRLTALNLLRTAGLLPAAPPAQRLRRPDPARPGP
ncbi:aspartate-semialdehyde dehydrogenase [Kitasatospora sp. MMS16-BH015]|uniref:Asd/ArgC dimerization domain-containing protein n=1 Tax=Kitasatospora sp. MMS16-BH015 TaxID=2018025 RepID=UPI000CA37E30|nr:Asd/ArgC dimerization domain-containing protein [Kitasatospora sp. MMS16-BH015]AUG78428.1 aspartate-semialdehyde dehydrogenase [Kitasatospora sp. MMS16-BH015]